MQTSPPLGAIDDVELEFKKGDQNLGPSPNKNKITFLRGDIGMQIKACKQ